MKYSIVPPWKFPSVEFCKCISSTKEEMSAMMMQNIFLEHLECHQDSIFIYTDGSKANAGVGFGITFPDFTRSGKLPEQASIFTAECYAILVAIKEIIRLPNRRFVIFSDSVSVLQALGQFNSVHPIIIEILEWLYLIENRGKIVKFCWVPAHVGVEGNEKADSLAKQAIDAVAIINISLPVRDMYPTIRSIIEDVWKFYWELENPKMKEVTNSTHPWKYINLKRHHEVLLCRLRIGHTRLTHGFLMSGEPPPVCEDCLVQLSVRHLLIECPSLIEKRERYFNLCKDNNGSFLLSKILGLNCDLDNLFNFLKDIKILDKI